MQKKRILSLAWKNNSWFSCDVIILQNKLNINPCEVLVLSYVRPSKNLAFCNVWARPGSSLCNRVRLNFQVCALRDIKMWLKTVLSSCTGSQEPIQKSQQCWTAKQRFVNKGVQWLFPLCTGTPGHNPENALEQGKRGVIAQVFAN